MSDSYYNKKYMKYNLGILSMKYKNKYNSLQKGGMVPQMAPYMNLGILHLYMPCEINEYTKRFFIGSKILFSLLIIKESI